MPYPLNIHNISARDAPGLRHLDSTCSWEPRRYWASTPTPDDSASNRADNDADLITSDDPWYLDVCGKLLLEKCPKEVCVGREIGRGEVKGVLKVSS